MTPEEALAFVGRLHAVVDELAAPLAGRHAGRLRCGRGCAGCCTDGLTVYAVEAAWLVRSAPDRLAAPPHPEGACAWLDADGGCRGYAGRPYVCRTQGLPLRFATPDGEGRDICPLNAPGGPPVEALPADACWTVGPFEARLALAQAAFEPATPTRRVALRDLLRG